MLLPPEYSAFAFERGRPRLLLFSSAAITPPFAPYTENNIQING
jgi:hypothetical protein